MWSAWHTYIVHTSNIRRTSTSGQSVYKRMGVSNTLSSDTLSLYFLLGPRSAYVCHMLGICSAAVRYSLLLSGSCLVVVFLSIGSRLSCSVLRLVICSLFHAVRWSFILCSLHTLYLFGWCSVNVRCLDSQFLGVLIIFILFDAEQPPINSIFCLVYSVFVRWMRCDWALTC